MTGNVKPATDWELVERHYRAGIKTLRQIGKEYGISHVAVQKHAKANQWTRDQAEKIHQKAAELVTKKSVTKQVTKETRLTDSQTVQAYAEIVANVDMTQRSDIEMALNLARMTMVELTALCNPDFADDLAHLGQLLAQPDGEDGGKAKMAKLDELYRYIALLPGRVKTLKEIAASHGVYIPIQRKVFKLDGDEKSNVSAYEDMLRAVGNA